VSDPGAISARPIDDWGVEVVVSAPPVNALRAEHWFELGAAIRDAGDAASVRCVVLRAEGKGFNAGVDIKEIQADSGHSALIMANRGCYEAFAAVYECAVPVVVAVNGYCLGGGVGLVGNADVIVASDDAYFGLPEVDRGALGAATHLSRLVPQHKARAMMYLAETASARELEQFGSVYRVVPPTELYSTALAVAERIASKNGRVIRAAKEAFSGIDLWDVRRSYRFEQGFTFEMNLAGVADELRSSFGTSTSDTGQVDSSGGEEPS